VVSVLGGGLVVLGGGLVVLGGGLVVLGGGLVVLGGGLVVLGGGLVVVDVPPLRVAVGLGVGRFGTPGPAGGTWIASDWIVATGGPSAATGSFECLIARPAA
jgi:hypothetical protein